jgi:tetratricopeptide (TPR) repeat protein
MRSSIITWTVVAAALGCLPGEGRAQPAPAPGPSALPYPAAVADRLKGARDALANGDFAAADQAYEGALREATASGATAQAQVRLMHAQGIERWVAADASQARRLSTAETYYRQVIADGTPAQQRIARNNLGTLLLKRQAAADALPVLQGIDLAADPDKRFAFEYNLGRALEQTGRAADAFTHYLASIGAEPTFAPAREAAVGVLQTQPAPASMAVRLCELLMTKGQPASAAGVARTLLPKASSADGTVLLGELMRAWVAMSIDMNAFKSTEEPFLRSLPASRVREQADDVARAMLDDGLKVIPDPYMSRQRFPSWSHEQHPEAFAAFLKYAGDLYSRKSPQQALARYVSAWFFDHSNGESAVYAAMTVRDHPEVDEQHRVLDLLIEKIFADKMAYIRGEDWPNSLRMHLVLGNIFEQLGKWGPETDSHTAAFQFKAAIADEQRIRATDKTFSPSPGLYTKLAQAYVHLDKPALAREQYNRAILVFEQAGRKEEAAAIREQARATGLP